MRIVPNEPRRRGGAEKGTYVELPVTRAAGEAWGWRLKRTAGACVLAWYFCLSLEMIRPPHGSIQTSIVSDFVFMVAFPTAVACALVSSFLVSPRRSGLAWISLGVFSLPFVAAAIVDMWRAFFERL